MKVLVTGGAGFLGSHLMAALAARGHDAIGYDIALPGPEALFIAPSLRERFQLGGIADRDRLLGICRDAGIEAIIHAAGIVGQETALAQPYLTYQTNIMGLVTICEIARELGLRKVILMSSNAVYHSGDSALLTETDPVFSVREGNPAGHYGASKMAAEAIGMTYAQLQDFDFLSLRVTALYGFGMRTPMYIKPMVENAVRGLPSSFATGGAMRRDYTHILDCSEGTMAALEAPARAPGEQRILNIARGQARTATEVAEVVRSLIPGAEIDIGPELNPLEAENVKMRAPLDIRAARRLLGWSPKWTLETGIAEYAERYRSANGL